MIFGLTKNNKGIIITQVLVWGSVFLILISSLFGLILTQLRQSRQRVALTESLEIAEAGINYARWHLNHSSDINFSGVYDYQDPEGGTIGKYQLNIIDSSNCSPGIKIESTGWTLDYPDLKRKIKVKYASASLAQYAFLTDANVWFGSTEEVKGPSHSNGGMRMDAQQNALSTSAKQTYLCGAEQGCSPAQEKPGIWGEGEGQGLGLWKFPVPIVDLGGITQNLNQIKEEAQSAGTYYGPSGVYGYHIEFLSEGKFNVYKVNNLREAVWGYDGENWIYESNSIAPGGEQIYDPDIPVPSDCVPIFVEDNLWVDGDLKGRTTVVAAKLPELEGTMKKMIINGNINCVDENSRLGLISQKDILIPLYSPNNLEIKAALFAVNGRVMRYYYPKWYSPYHLRDYIETYGSIISKDTWTFNWVDENEEVISGYRETEIAYNPSLIYDPPPSFPTRGERQFIKWEEVFP